MICPQCKTENQSDANFCFKCSHRFGDVGPTPGAQAQDGAILQGNNNQTVSKDGIQVEDDVSGDVLGLGVTKIAAPAPHFDAQHAYLPNGETLGFLYIPAGEFIMGSDPKKDKDSREDEYPQHKVNLPEFWIARYPVTVMQYRTFIENSRYKTTDQDSLRGQANHPVVNVTWYDALAYSKWLNEQMLAWTKVYTKTENNTLLWQQILNGNYQVMLPSEAEWEKTARGDRQASIYPWGDEFIPHKANTLEIGIDATSPVGCFPGGASPYGLLDASGNVWEWTRSLWGEDFTNPEYKYPYSPQDGRENIQAGEEIHRILRGGSFGGYAGFVRCSYRLSLAPVDWGDYYGFRVALSPLPKVGRIF